MKQLTKTQLEYAELVKRFGYIVVTEGPTYATYVCGKRQLGTSSFEALVTHNIITRISRYTSPNGLICSVWKVCETFNV